MVETTQILSLAFEGVSDLILVQVAFFYPRFFIAAGVSAGQNETLTTPEPSAETMSEAEREKQRMQQFEAAALEQDRRKQEWRSQQVTVGDGQGEGAEDEDDDNSCPICCNEFDETDKRFQACQCGYQICVWCFNKLFEESGKCPACRGTYSKEGFQFEAPDQELLKRQRSEEKMKKRASSLPFPLPALPSPP